MKDYEKTFEDFWREIVCNPDGSLNIEQVKKELHDFHYVMEQLPKVYDEITGGVLSKINYAADVVIAAYNDHVQDLCDEAIEDYKETLAE